MWRPIGGRLSQVAPEPASGRVPIAWAANENDILHTRWYARVCQRDLRSLARVEVEELFHTVDADNQGTIRVSEFAAVVAKACPRQVGQLIQETLAAADVSEDGKIDVDEFLQAMRLGTSDHVPALAAQLRGRDPRESERRIRLGQLVTYLRRRKEMRDNCFSLPFTLCFFAIFFALVLCHFRQQSVYRLTEAVARDMPLKQLENTYPISLWTWLESRAEVSRIARYNHLVGGVHISKISTRSAALQTLCSYTVLDYVASLFTNGPHVANGETTPKLCGDALGNTFQWLLWSLQRQDTLLGLQQVKSWWTLAPQAGANTSSVVPLAGPDRVEVSILAHNPNLNYYVLYRLSYHVPVSGSTKLETKAVAFDAAPLWLNSRRDWNRGIQQKCIMILDVVFLVMYMALLISKIWRFFRNLYRHGCRRGLSVYSSVWNAIDWFTIWMAIFMTIMYFYCNHLTRGLVQLTGQLPSIDAAQRYSFAQLEQIVQGRTLYFKQLNAVLEQAILLGKGQEDIRWYAAVFAFCLSLRFFKAFRGNPRLNLMLQTLKKAAVDLSHFFVVFIFLFLGFALVGHTIFGGRIELFSTVGDAVNSTFLFWLGFLVGDYKDQMFESGGALAILWTVAFYVLMVLLLLNVLVAIIFDVYAEVKVSLGNAPSVLQQTYGILAWPCSRSKAQNAQQQPRLDDSQDLTAAFDGVNVSESMALQKSDLLRSGTGSKRTGWTRLRFFDTFEGCLLRSLEDSNLAAHSLNKFVRIDDIRMIQPDVSEKERPKLEVIFARAFEQSRSEEEAISLSDSLRLCNLTDINVRELEPLTRELTAHVRRWEEEREELLHALATQKAHREERALVALADMHAQEPLQLAPQNTGPEADAAKSTDELALALQNRGPEADTARRSDEHVVREDSPEPEPASSTILSAGPSQQQLQLQQAQLEHQQLLLQQQLLHHQQQQNYRLMEDRMARAAAAQAERYKRLEEAISRLARRLEPMLQGSRDVMVDPRRIERLEEKVRKLMTTLAPVMDMDGPFSHPQKDKRLRPPTPPRALMAPAPAKVPRARGATPALWSRGPTPAASRGNTPGTL